MLKLCLLQLISTHFFLRWNLCGCNCSYDAFDINYSSIERLKRWRQAALLLNASHYTVDLKKEEKRHTLRKIRGHAEEIKAAYLFKNAAVPPINGGLVPKRLGVHIFSKSHLSTFEDRQNHDADDPISSAMNFNLWEKKSCIGSGGYGIVHVGLNRKTGTLCAIKEMLYFDDRYAQALHKEIKILSQLEHQNIVKYYGSEIVESQVSIYMEYVQPGSLKKYTVSRGALQESLVRKFTAQILSGLAYLHSQRVVHRDIKPDNLLVDSQTNVKVADFGLAKHLAQSVGNHSVDGTFYYAAPEVIQKKAYKSYGEAYAADIWSLGCVVIEMFTGMHPWPDCSLPIQAAYKVCCNKQNPAIPVNLSNAGKGFLNRCFVRDPAKRLSAADLLSHPFVTTKLGR